MSDPKSQRLLSLPEKHYLALGITMPWENNLAMQFGFWEQAAENGLITQLRDRCGSSEVVGLFCHECSMAEQTFSYHIACENKLSSASEAFETLTLKPSTYALFTGECPAPDQRFTTYERLCEAFWGKWLPASGYVSLIEPETFACEPGYAAIEHFDPAVPLGVYRLNILFPVQKA